MRNLGNKRRSHRINSYPAVNIHHARRFAELDGKPLNTFVTINLSQCGIDEAAASQTFQRLVSQRFSPWLRRGAENDNNLQPTYVWAIEAPHGKHGVHWLVHLPKRMQAAFHAKIFDWLKGLGDMQTRTAVKIQPVWSVVGATRYLLKGIDPVWAKHLEVAPVDQGEVIGKRSGFSRNLGPTIRKRSGYKPSKHRY